LALVLVGGDHGAVQAKGPQEAGQHHSRGKGMLGGAVQVDVQLAVRELAPQLVRDVDSERGLADPGLTGHRRHHRRRRRHIDGRAR
jgi:hypothetical protein